jgi:hypothetical protein
MSQITRSISFGFVFPTIGKANPTLTIAALSLWAGEIIDRDLRVWQRAAVDSLSAEHRAGYDHTLKRQPTTEVSSVAREACLRLLRGRLPSSQTDSRPGGRGSTSGLAMC